ncbi:MAG: type II secretion system F family protein [Candidatus Omnitrophica bacterium]|nr:type II secretion system F family protein [Candidatus Omnitrophota bacterium]MBU4478508.1 type II secretion system F family protein [Candidatus Omnitrophota bacterium]MCG2703690.1 type II secretion system F family protein [Candidatus Omnitrophota bacterium]
MPAFIYKARDAAGKLISGTLEASNRGIVADKLRAMGYFVVTVAEDRQQKSAFSADIFELFARVGARDLVIFNNQLATMIGSGITLVSSLNILSQQVENKKLQEVISKVRDDVEAGGSFSSALEKHPRVFSPLFVNMINAGETGGALEEILHRLAVFAEQSEEISGNVKTALTYPVLIVIVALSVVLFLVMGVFPKFESLFKSMDVPLPLPTQILLLISHWLRAKWYFVVAGIVAALTAFFRYRATPVGRYNVELFMLKIPIFGMIMKKASISRFARTLGTLINSGVPILQALRIVENTVGNAVIAKTVTIIAESVNRGESMATPLREDPIFPPMVGHMVSVGEESGTLDSILNKIADFYDSEVNSTVKRLSSIIEPVLLVIIGGVVGMIALSLFLPMFSLVKVFR